MGITRKFFLKFIVSSLSLKKLYNGQDVLAIGVVLLCESHSVDGIPCGVVDV